MCIALAVMAACSSDGGGIPIEELAAAEKDAECTYLTRCGMFPDKATCMTAWLGPSLIRDSNEPNLVDAVRDGRVRYDGIGAQRCIEAIAAQTCDDTDEDARWNLRKICSGLMGGTMRAGAPCLIGAECISGSCPGGNDIACLRATCEGETAPMMIVWAEIGERCDDYEQVCTHGAWCDRATRSCQPLKSEGQPCDILAECDYGLGCVGETDARVCKPLPGPGEPCPDGACRDVGQYCSATTGTCTPVGFTGAACSTYEECSWFYPCTEISQGMFCTPRLVGATCVDGHVPLDCFEENAYCAEGPYICTSKNADGEPCEHGGQCVSGYCQRDSTSAVCTQPPPACNGD